MKCCVVQTANRSSFRKSRNHERNHHDDTKGVKRNTILLHSVRVVAVLGAAMFANRLSLAVLITIAAVTASRADVTIERNDRGAAVKIDGKPFTEYLKKAGQEPALYPVIGPTGKPVT